MNRYRGFTLIELLVVVLIIGILAAIALPQYQKAVEKAHLTEAITRISTLEKVMDLHTLENGYDWSSFFGKDAIGTDINIKVGLEDLEEALDLSISPYFNYQAYCSNSGGIFSCRWFMSAADVTVKHRREYVLWGERAASAAGWTHYCEYDEDDTMGKYVCTLLYNQGWQQGDLFY